jgi:protein-L-isoaspartate(D-aspartate) O-methyltransferase
MLFHTLCTKLAPVLLPLLASSSTSNGQQEQEHDRAREDMISQQLQARGIKDERVLSAVREIPRHLFVPEDLKPSAYEDKPLPIGTEQTISQPYIVALMTELLNIRPDDIVLEIGTGSGYQTAVLAKLASQVYSIEIVPTLMAEATERLRHLGFTNISVMGSDGYHGWPEHAPFDRIIVTAAPQRIPPALVAQLRRGGRMVVPVGQQSKEQNLLMLDKDQLSDQIVGRKIIPVRFVPMVSQRGAIQSN